MKKKIKGIDFENEPQTVPDLLLRIDQEYEKRKAEAQTRQDARKEELRAEIQKERNLTKTLKKANQIMVGMIADFEEIEAGAKARIKKETEKNVLREADVRSGKATLKEFHSKGEFDKELSKKITDKVAVDLESISHAVRAKRVEIWNLEKSLYEIKHRIRSMVIQPGLAMLDIFKQIAEYGGEQVTLFTEDLPAYHDQVKEIQNKLWMVDGKSLSGLGHTWDSRTAKEARKLILDPRMPLDLIPSLYDQLERIEDDGMVGVYRYLKPHEIEVKTHSKNLKSGKQRVTSPELPQDTGVIQNVPGQQAADHLKIDPKNPITKDRFWDKEKTMKKPTLVSGDIQDMEEKKKREEVMAEKKKEQEQKNE